MKSKKPLNILVTGASGYIGGRLVEELLKTQHHTVSMVRRPDQFEKKFPFKHTVVYGDTLDQKSIDQALEEVDIAFYLIHSLSADGGFEEIEEISARNFIKSAEKNNVKKIVYLGGLFDKEATLSAHLSSRKKVGDILRSSSIPTITFRASIIIGSGSASFELIRNVTERWPIMITSKWIRIKAQPISIRDVLAYLKASVEFDAQAHHIFEIGGQDKVSYLDIIKEYASQRQLKRLIIPVPFLTPHLSSLWLALVTPLYAKIGKKLIESIKTATIVTDQEKTDKAFSVQPMSMKEAIRRAIIQEDQLFTKTHWASSYSASNFENKWLEHREGNKFVYTKKIVIKSSIEGCFEPIQGIGGENGWHYADFLWATRGVVDLLLGGPGHKRGRKHPVELHEGDFLDWWRVEQFTPPNILRLHAEMRIPGDAWLEFELKEQSKTETQLYVSAIFDPKGVRGRFYWYTLYPVHFFMFNGILKKIKKVAESKNGIMEN